MDCADILRTGDLGRDREFHGGPGKPCGDDPVLDLPSHRHLVLCRIRMYARHDRTQPFWARPGRVAGPPPSFMSGPVRLSYSCEGDPSMWAARNARWRRSAMLGSASD